MGFVYDKIQSLPDVKIPIYVYTKKSNQLESEKDKYVLLLSKFYYYPLDCLESVLELGANYVRKRPDTYTLYCDSLKMHLFFGLKTNDMGSTVKINFVTFCVLMILTIFYV
jgi:hypothetical protein